MMERQEAIEFLRAFMLGREKLAVKDDGGTPIVVTHDCGYLAVHKADDWSFLEQTSTIDIFELAKVAERIKAETVVDDRPKPAAGENKSEAKREEQSKPEDKPGVGDKSKYLDPKQNPYIKLDPSAPTITNKDESPDNKYLDPKQNPFIKL